MAAHVATAAVSETADAVCDKYKRIFSLPHGNDAANGLRGLLELMGMLCTARRCCCGTEVAYALGQMGDEAAVPTADLLQNAPARVARGRGRGPDRAPRGGGGARRDRHARLPRDGAPLRRRPGVGGGADVRARARAPRVQHPEGAVRLRRAPAQLERLEAAAAAAARSAAAAAKAAKAAAAAGAADGGAEAAAAALVAPVEACAIGGGEAAGEATGGDAAGDGGGGDGGSGSAFSASTRRRRRRRRRSPSSVPSCSTARRRSSSGTARSSRCATPSATTGRRRCSPYATL